MHRPPASPAVAPSATTPFELMAIARSGISPRLIAHLAGRRHRRAETSARPRP